MAQLATDKWLNKRYGVSCKEYPIYRTIKFSNVNKGPATGDIYYCISGHSTSSYVGQYNYTVTYKNPEFTWTNRIKYNNELYDVYKITSGKLELPVKWNPNTALKSGIEHLFMFGWPFFGTIYIKASIAEDYKAPYDDGSNSYYYINDKTNIRVNMTTIQLYGNPDIMVPNLGNINVALSTIKSSYSNSPAYGRDIYYNFGTTSTTKFGKSSSDVTLYYKCSIKLNSSTNSNLTSVYIYQDESSILNVYRGGISRNNYEFDASIGGDKIGKLQPSNDGDKGVVISNNNRNILSNNISSLESSFNCIDTSLASDISLTQDYFERKTYELRHVPIIGYSAASMSRGIISNFSGNNYRQSQYWAETAFSVSSVATMGGNIKIFPPTITGLDILLGNTTSLPFNQIMQFPYFNDLSYKPTTTQINNQLSKFIYYGKPSGYNSLHINNVLFSDYDFSSSICNDTNHTNDVGGFIPTLYRDTSRYVFKNALANHSNTFEGFTYGISRYMYSGSVGQSFAPFCVGYLSSYISPGLDITNKACSVEVDKDIDHSPEWLPDSNNISGTVVDGYLCDIYYSDYNKGVSNGEARTTITISGLQTFRCYIRAWAESASFDYVVISNLNEGCTRSSYKIKGVNSQTEWTLVEYENLNGETYTIEVLYTKDGSYNSNDDRGYLAIPRLQEQSLIDLSTTYLPYKTIDYLTKTDADKIYYHPTLYNTKLSVAYTNGYISKGITNANGYAAIPVVTIPSSIVPGATSITITSAHIKPTRINASSIRLSVTLPTKLGPFKLRNFAYHTTPSCNPFLTHDDISTTNIKKITDKITTQLGITGAITATQYIAYKNTSGSIKYGYAGILDIGRHYTATCSSTSGVITLNFVRVRTTATCTVSFATSTVSRGNSDGPVYFETLNLPELLVDSTCTRTTILTKDSKQLVAF